MKDEGPRPRIADPGLAWHRAACALHENEQRLREFVGDMYRLADGLVVRLGFILHLKANHPVMVYALRLRGRLEAEARTPPTLHRWQRTFDHLKSRYAEIEPELESYLEEFMEERGIPDAAWHQLPLPLETRRPAQRAEPVHAGRRESPPTV